MLSIVSYVHRFSGIKFHSATRKNSADIEKIAPQQHHWTPVCGKTSLRLFFCGCVCVCDREWVWTKESKDERQSKSAKAKPLVEYSSTRNITRICNNHKLWQPFTEFGTGAEVKIHKNKRKQLNTANIYVLELKTNSCPTKCLSFDENNGTLHVLSFIHFVFPSWFFVFSSKIRLPIELSFAITPFYCFVSFVMRNLNFLYLTFSCGNKIKLWYEFSYWVNLGEWQLGWKYANPTKYSLIKRDDLQFKLIWLNIGLFNRRPLSHWALKFKCWRVFQRNFTSRE